jgi:predicted nucleotidyltransferase
MEQNGYCKVCPRKCFWETHQNQPFYWDFKEVEETRTAEDLKRKYQDAMKGQTSHKAMVANLHRRYEDVKNDLRKRIDEARQCVNRLEEIAARPNPLSEIDYIDILIDAEQQEKKSGWAQRVKHLQEARQYAVTQAAILATDQFIPRELASRWRK